MTADATSLFQVLWFLSDRFSTQAKNTLTTLCRNRAEHSLQRRGGGVDPAGIRWVICPLAQTHSVWVGGAVWKRWSRNANSALLQWGNVVSLMINSTTIGHQRSAHIILTADIRPLPWAKSFMSSACWCIDLVFFFYCLHRTDRNASTNLSLKQARIDQMKLKWWIVFDNIQP